MIASNSQLDFLSRLLDAASLRHRAVAQNIANVNTPGYRAVDVAFEETLTRQLGQGGEATAVNATPQIVERPLGEVRADGNNVDIDAELGRVSKNTLLYNAYAQILAGKIAAMRSAITGR